MADGAEPRIRPDETVRWGNVQTAQFLAAAGPPFPDQTIAQFLQFDLKYPTTVKLRLSATSGQAPAVPGPTLAVTFMLLVGVGSAMLPSQIVHFVTATLGSPTDDVFLTLPARNIVVSATAHCAIPGNTTIQIAAQAAPLVTLVREKR